MLEKITWSQYWTTIGSATAIYYVAVGFLFYRNKILSSFNRPSPSMGSFPSGSPSINVMGTIQSEKSGESINFQKETQAESTQEDSPQNIHILDKTTQTGEQITEALSALGAHTNVQDLVTTLSAIVKEQNTDNGLAPFREAIDWHISQKTLDSCGIVLEDTDLEAIWNTSI